MKHMEHMGSSGDIESFFSWQWAIKHGDRMEIPNLNGHFDTREGTLVSTRRGQSPRFFFHVFGRAMFAMVDRMWICWGVI